MVQPLGKELGGREASRAHKLHNLLSGVRARQGSATPAEKLDPLSDPWSVFQNSRFYDYFGITAEDVKSQKFEG